MSMALPLQLQPSAYNTHSASRFSLPQFLSNKIYAATSSPPPTRRRALSLFTITTFLSGFAFSHGSSSNYSWSKPEISDFVELPNSGGVKALDLRIGDAGETPSNGDKVVIHYYGRLAAKQGWRFDSTYDHKDDNGEPIPFEFVLGSGKVAFVGSSYLHLKDIKIHLNNLSHLIFLTDRGYSPPFSIQHVWLMEKAQPWGHSYLILSWSASDVNESSAIILISIAPIKAQNVFGIAKWSLDSQRIACLYVLVGVVAL